MMKISNKIPLLFLEYQKKLKPSLEAKGIKQSFVYRSIGMSKTTWDRRNRLYNFTAHEILKICEVINGRE